MSVKDTDFFFCGEGTLNINLHTKIHCGITFPVAYMQRELSAVVFSCHSELDEEWLRVPCFISLVHVQSDYPWSFRHWEDAETPWRNVIPTTSESEIPPYSKRSLVNCFTSPASNPKSEVLEFIPKSMSQGSGIVN